MNAEFQFPTGCPNCGRLTAVHSDLHCPKTVRSTPCGWLRCTCGCTFDHTGKHFGGPKKEAS